MGQKGITEIREFIRAGKPIGLAYPTDYEFTENDDGTLTIEGWANTTKKNSYDVIVEATAWTDSVLEDFMQHPIMLWAHDGWILPIGVWTEVERKKGGLWAKGKLADTALGRDAAKLVMMGATKALSVGFRSLTSEFNSKTGVETITEIDNLREISLAPTGFGVDKSALVTQAYSDFTGKLNDLGLDKRAGDMLWLTPGQKDRKGTIMAKAPAVVNGDDHKLNEFIDEMGEIKTTVQSNVEAVSTIETNFTEQTRIINEYMGKAEQRRKGLATQAEVIEMADKMGGRFEVLQKNIDASTLAIKENDRRNQLGAMYVDVRHLAGDFSHLTDENGQPLSKLDQQAWGLFNAPISDDCAGKDIVYAIRNGVDAIILWDAYCNAPGQAVRNFDIAKSKIFQSTVNVIRKYMSAEFADAMAGATAGAGSEWLPTLLTDEMAKLARVTPSLASRFQRWDMNSRVQDYPLMTGGATTYLSSEAATMNPTEATKSKVTTSKATFTASTFITLCPVSPELIEDSLVQMTPLIRDELARADSEALESAIVNGDTTSTHRDTAASFTNGVDVETAWMGLRYHAIDMSATHTAGGAGTADFTAAKCRAMRGVMSGGRGLKMQDLIWVLPLNLFFQVLSFNEMQQSGTYGGPGTWTSGTARNFDGIELVPTSKIDETMATDGINDGDASTHTGLVLVDTSAFKIGSRRGVTVEAAKNLRTQQVDIVATSRPAFQRVSASTDLCVVYGVNVKKS